jgi:hypothetical protein
MFKRYASLLLAVCAWMALGASASGAAPVAPGFGSTPTGFGFHSFEVSLSGTQAGSHPDLTVTFELNREQREGGGSSAPFPVGGEIRNLAVNLPPGLAGNATAVPQCTRQRLDEEGGCPVDTQIGVDTASLGGAGEGLFVLEPPVYNMVPPAGTPVQLAFDIEHIEVFIDAGVRSGGDNGITTHADNLPQRAIIRNTITIFGESGGEPFLTLPTSCGAPLRFSVIANTWEEPNAAVEAQAEGPAVTGCGRLAHFTPSISLAPDTSAADSPAGLSVDVRSPQGLNPEGLATSNLEDTTIVLPAGLAVNPGRASGLAACQPSQAGLGSETDEEPAACPAASRVGSVEIETPVLKDKLVGGVYVLQSNPPELQLLLAASGDGVNLKVVGKVHLDEATGQLTTTFSETPDLPFSDLKMVLEGGPQGALVTPDGCGVFTTNAAFTPWSSPFIPGAVWSSSFGIESGPGGSSCGSLSSFAPSFTAGTANNQAGAFSPFGVTFSRQDGERDVGGVQVTTPPGLLGVLKGVERCPEPQASQGTCGPNSLVGHATVAAGAGPDPLYVQGGQVFLTGPYKGAPFGLSIVVPAVAGPFNLGNVVVRAAIGVDPHTAQITVSSDPLPTILDGIPLQVKTVNVSIDRAGFIFNPTNCEPLSVGGTLTSTQGSSAGVSSRFQAANCAALGFNPSFSVSSQAKTSKKNGASLVVRVGYPSGAQANIRSVAVTLPKQLPARLTTIQQACPEAVFDANPAGCPAGSVIGTGTASTPILAGQATGPVYLVSHGGAAFPDVVVILQDEGVTLDLVGSIDIKHDVTSSTFASVPDAPIGSFQLTLPEGPHSGLAAVVPAKAKASLCGQSLVMPTTITGQNGAVIEQSTKIAVTGCPKAKKKTAKKKAKRRGKKGGKK